MGVSVNNVKVKIPGTKLEQAGPLLITHWGLSGPVILRLSAWGARELAEKKYEFSVIVNWVPAYNEQSLRSFLQQQRHMAAGKKISAKNPFGLPQRLWDYLLHAADADSSLRWADLPARNQNSLVRYLCSHELLVRGKTTFKEEFVTAGGISLQEIDPVSMESKRVKNLFFAGEIMDVDGITGGYNFQHAWTSGFIAAKTIADRGGRSINPLVF
jgi:predicted Rossmann fold flavoprotein